MIKKIWCLSLLYCFSACAMDRRLPSVLDPGIFRMFGPVKVVSMDPNNLRVVEAALPWLSFDKDTRIKERKKIFSIIMMEPNNKEVILFLLSKGWRPDELGGDGLSVFHMATCGRDNHNMRTLLTFCEIFNSKCAAEKYIDINRPAKDGSTPLDFALLSGNDSVAEELLAHGAPIALVDDGIVKANALYHAIMRKRVKCMKWCLLHGADPNIMCDLEKLSFRGTCFKAATKIALNGYPNVLDCLLSEGYMPTRHPNRKLADLDEKEKKILLQRWAIVRMGKISDAERAEEIAKAVYQLMRTRPKALSFHFDEQNIPALRAVNRVPSLVSLVHERALHGTRKINARLSAIACIEHK